MNEIAEKIRDYNKGRLPVLLAMKYKAMYEDRYRFYRAIPHVLYDDIPKNSFLYNSPNVWLCGDLHLENLGSYKGDNRITYFGVNDFDECILGPLLIDVSRLLTSILVSAHSLGLSKGDADKLCKTLIDKYFSTLQEGYIRVIECETARGVMKDFLNKVLSRKRKDLLKKRTIEKKGELKLKLDGVHTLSLSKKEKEEVTHHIHTWAKKMPDPGFYKVKDVLFRIAGTSSLGLRRYAILVKGRGGKAGHFLLDLKETLPSCLAKHVKAKQPDWKSEAERIAEVQKRTLSAPPALLGCIDMGKRNFILKELQPSADRIDYTMFKRDTKNLKNILEDMASICAWSNLRSTGRDGSAIADELIHFAKARNLFEKALIQYSKNTFERTIEYHKQYCDAYKKGYFNVITKS